MKNPICQNCGSKNTQGYYSLPCFGNGHDPFDPVDNDWLPLYGDTVIHLGVYVLECNDCGAQHCLGLTGAIGEVTKNTRGKNDGR